MGLKEALKRKIFSGFEKNKELLRSFKERRENLLTAINENRQVIQLAKDFVETTSLLLSANSFYVGKTTKGEIVKRFQDGFNKLMQYHSGMDMVLSIYYRKECHLWYHHNISTPDIGRKGSDFTGSPVIS